MKGSHSITVSKGGTVRAETGRKPSGPYAANPKPMQIGRYAGPGTWYCPTCADLQFKNNTKCRICALPREQGVTTLDELGDPVEIWLAGYHVEEHALKRLRALPADEQLRIVNEGTLANSTDATGVVVSRLNRHHAPREGDWYCGVCFDAQFAKNSSCRRCGADRSEGRETPPNPEEFLRGYDISFEMAEEFHSLPEGIKQAVINSGTLQGSKDPTNVLRLRIIRFRDEGGVSHGKNSGAKGKGKDKDKGKSQGYGKGCSGDYGWGAAPAGWGGASSDGWDSEYEAVSALAASLLDGLKGCKGYDQGYDKGYGKGYGKDYGKGYGKFTGWDSWW